MHQVKLRSPVGVIFFGMITFGIYYWYWFYKVNEEAAILANDENANPGVSLLAATVGSLLIVPVFWTHWTTAKRVGAATDSPVSNGMNVLMSILLLPFAGIVYPLWLQGKLNKYGRRQRAQLHQAGLTPPSVPVTVPEPITAEAAPQTDA